MTDARGFRADGTHIDTGVARDPQGYNQAGEHISESKTTRGLRAAQPREQDGKFGEKTGTSPEVALGEEATVGILGETPSQYARRSQRLDQLIRADLRIPEEETIEQALRYSDIDGDSLRALMHAGIEEERKPENLASFPEVDELYAQAAQAELRLVNDGFRSLLDEHRPGTKSVLLGTWSGAGEVDLVAYENEDGSLDAEYESIEAVLTLVSAQQQRLARLTESGTLPTVPREEASQFSGRVIGSRRLHGSDYHRIGESL